MEKNEIILYQPDNSIQLEVRLEDETVWLTQAQMILLFDTTKQNVSLHINNIFKERELEREATVKDFLTVQSEGRRSVQRIVSYYNLDVIISVGYRVHSSHRQRCVSYWCITERFRKEIVCLFKNEIDSARIFTKYYLMSF
jgi:hypothetical protein